MPPPRPRRSRAPPSSCPASRRASECRPRATPSGTRLSPARRRPAVPPTRAANRAAAAPSDPTPIGTRRMSNSPTAATSAKSVAYPSITQRAVSDVAHVGDLRDSVLRARERGSRDGVLVRAVDDDDRPHPRRRLRRGGRASGARREIDAAPESAKGREVSDCATVVPGAGGDERVEVSGELRVSARSPRTRRAP